MTPVTAVSDPLSRAYDTWADTYDAEHASRPETATEDALVVSWLRDRLPVGSSLLDVGCGTGWLLDRMEWPRALYYGFDISTGMLDRAQEKHGGYLFRQHSILDLWPSYPHDWRAGTPKVAVAMWSVLNHLTGSEVDLAFDRFAVSGGDRLLATVRTPAAPGATAAQSPDELAGFVYPHALDRLAVGIAGAGLALTDHFGFLYGGDLAPPDEAHYLALEITR